MCILDSYDILNVFFFIVGPSAVKDFVENSNLSTLSNEGKWVCFEKIKKQCAIVCKNY